MKTRRNKYDDLEKLFRSRMKDDTPAENSWNVPPDFILENVQQNLSSDKKKRRKGFWIWIFAAVLLFSLIGLQLYTSARLNQIENGLKMNDNKMDESGFALDNRTNENKTSSKLINKATTEETSSELDLSSEITGINNNIKKAELPLNKPSFDQLSSQNDFVKEDGISIIRNNSDLENEAHSEIVAMEQSSVDNESSMTPNSENIAESFNNPQTAINNVERIPNLAMLQLNYEHGEEIMFLETIPFDKKSEERRRTEVYAFSAFTLSSFRMTNTEQNQFSLTKYDKNYIGYQIGLGLKFNLVKNLQLNSSFAWSRMNNESLYQGEMVYDPSKEVIDAQGETIYETDMKVESPTSSYAANVRFSVADQNISENDILQNNTEIDQNFNSLHLSLGADYTILNAMKIELLISGGFTGNYMFHLNQDMQTKLSHTDQVLMEKSFNSKSMEEIKPYFLSVYGNVGMKYSLTDHFSLQLSGGWENALSPLRTTNAEVPSNTYLNHFKSQLFLAYRF